VKLASTSGVHSGGVLVSWPARLVQRGRRTMPHLRAGVGAVATQSISNRYLGPRVLDAMAAGLDLRPRR
jgi:uncharacterized Ntn-hydrolase superfamily protein